MSNRKSSERTPAPPLAVLIGQTAAKAPSGKTTEPAQSPYLAIFLASPLERIAMIKQGVPAQAAKQLFAVLDIGQGDSLHFITKIIVAL